MSKEQKLFLKRYKLNNTVSSQNKTTQTEKVSKKKDGKQSKKSSKSKKKSQNVDMGPFSIDWRHRMKPIDLNDYEYHRKGLYDLPPYKRPIMLSESILRKKEIQMKKSPNDIEISAEDRFSKTKYKK